MAVERTQGPTDPMRLHAHDVQVRVGGIDVLRGVNLTLQTGQWVAIVGPNGCGKSTLLTTLVGLRAPHAGTVHLRGRDLRQWNAAQRAQHLSWLSQHWEGDGELSCQEVVSLGRLPHQGLYQPWTAHDQDSVEQVMQALGVAHLASRPIGALSGGERQRVLLARAFAVQASLVLLDEPTTHLDPPHARLWLQLLRQQLAQGVGLVTVLHDLNLALQADRVVVMHRGQVVADAPPGSADVAQALGEVFDQAVELGQVATGEGSRWVAWTR